MSAHLAGRTARAGARLHQGPTRRGPAGAAARLARPVASARVRPGGPVVGRDRAAPRGGRRRARERPGDRRAVPLRTPARAALLGRRAARLGRPAPAARRADLRLPAPRGRADGAALRGAAHRAALVRPAPSDRLPADDFHAERYPQDNVDFWIPRLVELGDLRQGQRVLDVGCGTGGFAVAIAEETSAQVVGCDRSPSFLAYAKQRSAAVEWVQGDAESLPFADSSFDRVLMSLLLHQLEKPTRAIAEACRVLSRPGALLVRTVLPDAAAAR